MANEVRLIDGNALRRKMADILLRYDTPETFGEKLAVYSVFDEVINSPTIDPESLRPKGRLEFKYIIDADYYSSVPAWFCTHCGWHIRDKGGKPKPPKMNYCPNCGAKMEV